MRLWTIQPVLFWRVLERDGVIVADGRRGDRGFRKAYQWMSWQCQRRGVLRRARFPIWAWHSWDGADRRRPDLRAGWHLPPGTAGVRIEFEVEDSAAVSSLFDAWHCVLNGWFVARDEHEARLAEERLVAERLGCGEIRESWERIFDLSFGSEAMWGQRDRRSVQACVGDIRSDWVRDVTEFVAR